MRTEALHAERDAIDAERPQSTRELLAERLRVCLDRDLLRRRQGAQEAFLAVLNLDGERKS